LLSFGIGTTVRLTIDTCTRFYFWRENPKLFTTHPRTTTMSGGESTTGGGGENDTESVGTVEDAVAAAEVAAAAASANNNNQRGDGGAADETRTRNAASDQAALLDGFEIVDESGELVRQRFLDFLIEL
jgi:hypothetical protein